jgi:hypothetical protein
VKDGRQAGKRECRRERERVSFERERERVRVNLERERERRGVNFEFCFLFLQFVRPFGSFYFFGLFFI